VVEVALEWKSITGGTVGVLGEPSVLSATGHSGMFEIDGIPACTPLTLVFEHPQIHAVQTGALFVANDDLVNVTLQTPDLGTYDLFVGMAGIEPDPARCQIATTVTRAANAGYGPCHACGEPDATVSLWPPDPSSQGPVYFQLESNGIIYPSPSLTATTADGGVLFANVTPGDYLLVAHKDGFVSTPARVTCRAGWFVNASPPYGIQGTP